MKNLKRKISFNEKSFLELKKFRVDWSWNLIDITISLIGGNEIENNGCLVKEIQLRKKTLEDLEKLKSILLNARRR